MAALYCSSLVCRLPCSLMASMTSLLRWHRVAHSSITYRTPLLRMVLMTCRTGREGKGEERREGEGRGERRERRGGKGKEEREGEGKEEREGEERRGRREKRGGEGEGKE